MPQCPANPTIGKLGEIAKALDVGIIDLLNEDKEENAIICPHCGKKIKNRERRMIWMSIQLSILLLSF